MYIAKNHNEGPDKTVIEGELAIVGGKLTYNGTEIKPAAAQADSKAADVAGIVADFNALLAKLRAAGLLTGKK